MKFKLKQLAKMFHTLKYLKFKQVYYRFYNKVKKPAVTDFNLDARNKWQWDGPSLNPQSILNANKVVFLSKQATIEVVGDWNSAEHSKLWLYNLHYFDDLSACDYQTRKLLHYQFIDRWIEENPPCSGNGWEPYPLSLRLVNWVKWFSKKDTVDTKYLSSIAQQSQALMQQIEYHILGNHLFSNAKALTFVGAFLTGHQAEKCLQKGLELLDHEVQEQFLADGAHFELSPMYHCILLWDLLELIHLGQLNVNKHINARTENWKAIASNALTWLKSMIHTDGEVSFFNDSAMGIANTPTQIFNYAKKLGLIWDENHKSLVVNKFSGYSRIDNANYSLIFDHANVGPDYLPGHAHADTLSFELSVGVERLFVNSGTSLYGVSQERLRQRQTAAHNTVEVMGESSSEVWSGFRVARRAYSELIEVIESNSEIKISASHNGYNRLKPKVTHTRKIHSTESSFEIIDLLSSPVNSCFHLHIHPNVKSFKLDSYTIKLTLKSNKVVFFKSEKPVKLVASSYHPNFGATIENYKIIVPFTDGSLLTRVEF